MTNPAREGFRTMETLSPEERRVLKVLLSTKMLRGRDLLKRSRLDKEAFATVVQPLIEAGYVQASAGGLDPDRISTARFYVPPSAASYLQEILRGR